METTLMGLYKVSGWGFIGMMEKNMETTLMRLYKV